MTTQDPAAERAALGAVTRPCRVLLSGGLDSVTCLAWALERHDVVDAVFFEYGQRHLIQERAAARAVAEIAGVTLHEREVLWLRGGVVGGNDLSASGAVVPGRNAAFLANSIAPGELPSVVVMGCCRDDWPEFEDCRPEFFDEERGAMPFGVRIETPLIRKTKGQVVLLAESLGWGRQAVELSWSCYAGGEAACGRCGACVARDKGLREAAILRRPCSFCGAEVGARCFHPSHGFVGFHETRT